MSEQRWFATANLTVSLLIAAAIAQFPGSSDVPSSSPVVFAEGVALVPPSDTHMPGVPIDDEGATIRLFFVGDIMQHAAQAKDDFDASYRDVANLFRGADLVVGNLEFPVHPYRPVGPPAGSVQFNGSPENLDALARAGFGLLSTANNHAFDQGLDGISATIRETTSRAIRTVGTATAREGQTPAMTILERGGIRIAVFAYTASLNTYVDDHGSLIDPPVDLPLVSVNFGEWSEEYRQQGIELFRRDVARARAAGADFVVALPHWGDEWRFGPNKDQILAAHDMIDTGFDLIVGGHGHVINTPEIYRERLVVYSLGNFVSDFPDWRTRTGAALEISLTKPPKRRAALAWFCFHPLWTEHPGHVVRLLSPPVPGATPDPTRGWELAQRLLGRAAVSCVPGG